MEDPPSLERATAVRRDNVRASARDGIEMDGEWEYWEVCGRSRRHGSAEACMFFV